VLDQVWSRVAVEENNLYAQISVLRKALGTDAIATVSGRGYRLAVPRNDEEPPSADKAEDADRPTVAVLPFACLADGALMNYFAHGMADEIATALSRFRSFLVCVPLSINGVNAPADARLAAQRHGARYAIEGSVCAAPGRMRIIVRLVEVLSGLQLWAERLDGTIEDIFELQDRVAARVAAAVAPRLVSAEIMRVHDLPPGKGGPYCLLLRGLSQYCTRTRLGMEQAIRLLRKSIAIDPTYALAHAHLASIQWMMLTHFWATHDDPMVRDALGNAQTALTLAADDPEVLLLVSTVVGTRGDDVDGAISPCPRTRPRRCACKACIGCLSERSPPPMRASPRPTASILRTRACAPTGPILSASSPPASMRVPSQHLACCFWSGHISHPRCAIVPQASDCLGGSRKGGGWCGASGI